jgi:predicted O-methyltransferase YrrM
MNSFIESIYTSGQVKDRTGAEHKLHSSIDPEEGIFIEKIILDNPGISRTLEVGCAYGLSSLHICHAISSRVNPSHIILDPFQNSYWKGVGVKNLEDSGVKCFKLIEKGSEFALPELLQLGEARFDLVFIDGMHTLDHTLLDCFYATRLLKIGGFLVVDDVDLPPVGRTVDYVSFYPCYKIYAKLGCPMTTTAKRRMARAMVRLMPDRAKNRLFHPALTQNPPKTFRTRMIALEKVSKDERNWDWFPAGF